METNVTLICFYDNLPHDDLVMSTHKLQLYSIQLFIVFLWIDDRLLRKHRMNCIFERVQSSWKQSEKFAIQH